MTMRAPLLFTLLLAARLAGQTDAPQDPVKPWMRLVFDEVAESKLLEGASSDAFEPRTESQLTISIGPRSVILEQGGQIGVFDFEADTRRTFEAQSNTFVESSLLAEAAFLETELANRARLRGVMEAMGKGTGPFDPFELSVLFGWPADGDKFDLVAKEVDGRVTFRDTEGIRTAWTLSDHQLSEAETAMLRRALQRRAKLHPEILQALLAERRVPAELEFRWKTVSAETASTWTLKQAERLEAAPNSTASKQRAYPDDPLGALERLEAARESEGAPERWTEAQFLERIDAAIEAERFPDAFLLVTELGLSLDKQVRGRLNNLMSAPGAREQLADMIGALTALGRDPEAGLKQLDALDRQLFSRPGVLDAFRANTLRAMGRLEDGREAMLRALEQNPWLTLGYKDLGDMFFADYRMEDCWRAWDLGRRIAPDHSCWKRPEAYERTLRSRFEKLL